VNERIIQTEACVDKGAKYLAQLEPRFNFALRCVGKLPLRRRPDGFERLLGAIVSQQLSVTSANAIWKRIIAANLNGPRKILKAQDDDLRAAGLSRQKITYARALAHAGINFKALREMSTTDVVSRLTQVKGIGTWTAEIYAMFSLGRADVFAPGDLALQEAVRILFSLDSRPDEKRLRNIADQWSPWRSVAARLLWSYYAYEKKREGVG